MRFRDYYLGMPTAERSEFALRCGTSRHFLQQVAYGYKQIELGFADVIVRLSGRQVSLDELPLTDRAQRQRQLRESGRPSTAKV